MHPILLGCEGEGDKGTSGKQVVEGVGKGVKTPVADPNSNILLETDEVVRRCCMRPAAVLAWAE